MFQRHVSEVEMYTFEQQVGCDKYIGVAVAEHGAVIAHSLYGGGIDGFQPFCQSVNQAKFAKF